MNVFANPKIIACTIALATCVASTALSAATVVNGDFESTDTSIGVANGNTLDNLQSGPGLSWDVFSSIPGWSTGSGPGIEVQTTRSGFITPNSGDHYVELDSHGAASNSSMYQDIAFTQGTYQLSFWYSPRVNNGGGTNTVDYSIGSALSGSINGPGADAAFGVWTQIVSDTFTVASDTTLRLSFQASGEDETLGGFIDNVSITAVPLPAAAWLFGSALFGLITMRRRKAID
jgi:hypothetical protein